MKRINAAIRAAVIKWLGLPDPGEAKKPSGAYYRTVRDALEEVQKAKQEVADLRNSLQHMVRVMMIAEVKDFREELDAARNEMSTAKNHIYAFNHMHAADFMARASAIPDLTMKIDCLAEMLGLHVIVDCYAKDPAAGIYAVAGAEAHRQAENVALSALELQEMQRLRAQAQQLVREIQGRLPKRTEPSPTK